MIRTDDGEVMRIDRIIDVREAPALKVGGQGTRYTCQIPQNVQVNDAQVITGREIYGNTAQRKNKHTRSKRGKIQT